ncbi:MAG: XTP/dITP diphosphatase [Desulfobulbaceae bacterium]|nr:XTP/dITP diphosphatase [Desulfobulbaceae bacterium]
MQNIVLVLATRNKGKVLEFQEMLKGYPVEIRCLNDFGPIPEVEEDGETFDDNAYKKALFTAKVLGLPAISDDSGLVVEALGGEPGVHSARYAGPACNDQANIDKLLAAMKGETNRRAAFHCVVSIAVPSGPALTYEGQCHGVITEEVQGAGGFGYDPVFFCPELGKTFAQASMEEKNRISHRGKALQEVGAEFDKILVWLKARMAEMKPAKPDHTQFEHNDWSQEKMV